MIISTKCQYALRAVFEIARSGQDDVLTIERIAKLQKIPRRYLEGILNQLRKGGILTAQRGRSGGYRLAREAARITVGDVVRLVDGRMSAVACADPGTETDCPMRDNCVFLPTWIRVQQAIDATLDSSNFGELLANDQASRSVPSFSI